MKLDVAVKTGVIVRRWEALMPKVGKVFDVLQHPLYRCRDKSKLSKEHTIPSSIRANKQRVPLSTATASSAVHERPLVNKDKESLKKDPPFSSCTTESLN